MSFIAEMQKKIIVLRPVLTLAKVVFTPLALCFILVVAWQSRQLLGEVLSQSTPLQLVAGVLLWTLVHFITPLFTLCFFRSCQQQIKYRNAFLIHAGRLPAKYLPGGIWHSVARFADYHQQGFQHRQIGVYLLAENLLSLSVSLSLGGLCVSGLSQINSLWLGFSQLALVAGLLIMLLLPSMIKRKLLPQAAGFSLSFYLLSLLSMFCFWMIAALAFVQFVNAFPVTFPLVSQLEIAGVYVFSWGVGFLAIFAPQGIGISEYVTSQLLGADMGANSFLVLVAGFRIVVLAGDLLAWLLSVLYRRCVQDAD